jgi:hypothetical protein
MEDLFPSKMVMYPKTKSLLNATSFGPLFRSHFKPKTVSFAGKAAEALEKTATEFNELAAKLRSYPPEVDALERVSGGRVEVCM